MEMSFLPLEKGFKPKRGDGDTIKKRRGRPITKTLETKATMPARLSRGCWAYLMSERIEQDDSLSDTIMRLITDSNKKAIEFKKKLDALYEERERQTMLERECLKEIEIEVINK